MYHCNIKDNVLTGQWMVEIDGDGIVLDAMNTKRDNTASWPWHLTAIANIER
jgi:hypothetical protein